jgi:hypothetical protein
MADSIHYFAYGSNLYTPRLRWRVPSARVQSTATLFAHRLTFHKRSNDKSGKCDAYRDPDEEVIGLLYAIDEGELDALRRAEGAGYGYDEQWVDVVTESGEHCNALTYFANATHIDFSLSPYLWYHRFVSLGCKEHRLPKHYVDRWVESITARPDPDTERDKRMRLEVLGVPIRPIE